MSKIYIGSGIREGSPMKKVFVIILLWCIAGEYSWAEKRLPVLSDSYRIQVVSDPDISPDGQWIAYQVLRDNIEIDQEVSDIWRVSLDGKITEQLTFTGKSNNALPKWSPDGKWLAYLADSKGEGVTQVWLMRISNGKRNQLTQLKGSVSDFSWSPDSKQLALIAADSKEEPKIPQKSKPIVLDRYLFKSDGSGYLTQEREHLYLFTIQKKSVRLLTPGDHDEWAPSWSPDGKYIAYVTKRGSDPDRHLNYDLYLINPNNGTKEQQLTHFLGDDMDPEWKSNISWSPDSLKIAYLRSSTDHWLYYAPSQLAVINIANKKERVFDSLDRWLYKPKWSLDGTKIYALIEESRNTYLSEIDFNSGAVKRVTHGLRYDMDFVLAKDKMVVLTTDDLHPAELFVLDSKPRPLTHHNKELLEKVLFQPAEDIQFKSFDGIQIDGFLVKPAGYQPGKKYPSILNLHGGPVYQFNHEFNFEWQWFAANGYAVIAPNPRGSSGRGFNFAKAIYADWGNIDVKDVLAAVDYVVAKGVADPQKLAVGGWSYGGMLTNYVIASDKRFKAALSGAGAANILSNYGVDEYTLYYEIELGKPWEKADLYLKLSYPFMKSGSIKTATLFMCSQLDYNVPCEGSEQFYQALRSQNVPTQLVIYPDQHHELDVPSYVTDRLKRYTDWLDRYVK